MTLQVREMTQDDVQACGNICFTAFGNIARAHNFPLDFPTVESALGLTNALFKSPQVFSVVAEEDGHVVGSNHLWEANSIKGVGPISVDPNAQSKGAGRMLMQAAIERAKEAAGTRLVQDSFNAASLSLYTALGFDVKEPLVVIEGKPVSSGSSELEVRIINDADYERCADLCRKVHGFDRINEQRFVAAMSPSFVGIRDAKVVAYATAPTFWAMNHAVAESEEDLKTLLVGVGGLVDKPLSLLLPIRKADLYRWCLAEGMRVIKPMNLMSMGTYVEPKGAFLPSVIY